MRIVTAALVYLRFALEHPGMYRLMYGPELSERLGEAADPAGENPFQELVQEKAKAFAVFYDLVRQGQAIGEFRSDIPPDQAARLVTALAEGLAHQYLEERRGTERLKEAESLFEAFLYGISTQSGG